jgi:membrane protease subunit HflC
MKPRLVFLIALGLLAVLASFALFLTAYTVRATECAVVLRWEKPTKALVGTKDGDAGLHWKLPDPIDKVEKYDARTHVFSTKPEQTYTQDGYSLIVTVSSGWRIADPIPFREKVGTERKGQELLAGLVRTYKNAIIGKHPLSHMISADPETLGFDDMEKEMLSYVGKEAEGKYGMAVEFTKIKQLAMPKSGAQEVFNRMKEERETIAVDIREAGEEKAKKTRAEADTERDRILNTARAEAKVLQGQGDAEAAQYYEVFARNENLAIFLKEIETLKISLKDRATIVLTTNDRPYHLFKKGWKEEEN